MIIYQAQKEDIPSLVQLRMLYLYSDFPDMNKEDAELIEERLPEYFSRHLNQDLFCFLAKKEEEILSCAFLLISEKPMSPSFINGKTGTLLNVYTKPQYRRQGIAKALIHELLKEAETMNLSTVECKSTEEGYGLYKASGFKEVNEYKLMKWRNDHAE